MPFVRAGDLNVHYSEAGAGTPIILVHGNWGSCSWWEPTLTRLPASFRGLAYDVRGRGQTEGPDNGYTMPELAADLGAFADALGLDRFHLVGHSLGTAIAMQYVLDAPQRVLTLTVVAPAWVDGMPAAYANLDAQRALKDNFHLFATSLKALAPALPADGYWDRLVAEGHAQRLEAALKNADALLTWKPGDRLRTTGVPALVIDGANDPLTGGNVARAADVLNARAVVLPGIGHSPIVEAPDTFVALLIDHISRTA